MKTSNGEHGAASADTNPASTSPIKSASMFQTAEQCKVEHTPNMRNERNRSFGCALDSSDDDSCASCSFSVPEELNSRLPEMAPGSPDSAGTKRPRRDSPVLRTRQSVVVGDPELDEGYWTDSRSGSDGPSPPSGLTRQDSQHDLGTTSNTNSDPIAHTPRSTPSRPIAIPPAATSSPHSLSSKLDSSPPQTHTHINTYLTTHTPTLPSHYTLLRHSIIRTLSLETLPAGQSSGPLAFTSLGPPSTHTIAYIFRLPDPRARGHRRTYALLAVSCGDDRSDGDEGESDGNIDVGSVIASVMGVFSRLATGIVGMAEAARHEATSVGESEAAHTHPSSSLPDDGPGLMPVSSFLSVKQADPDGHPRSRPRRNHASVGGYEDMDKGSGSGSSVNKNTSGKNHGTANLAELVGRDGLFVDLHVAFVKALMMLRQES